MSFKEFVKNPLHVCIAIACIAIALYFLVLTYDQIKPKSLTEQKMHCLELGSNYARANCMTLINQ